MHEDKIKDEQSRTLIDVIMPESKAEFEFGIFFNNLAEIELGALLWSLTLEGKAYHRLGYAKPFGFGSVEIKIKDMEILNVAERYKQLSKTGYSKLDEVKQQEMIEGFKSEMAKLYGHQNGFYNLSNVADLLSLLKKEGAGLPVHYPRPQKDLTSDVRHYDWFIGNKKINKNAKRKQFFPERASEEKEGMGLVDRNGFLVD